MMRERKIKKENILRFLNHNFKNKEKLELLDFIFVLDSYELLGMEVPDKKQVIKYLNGLQSDEGTWETGNPHYVPTTAQVLMFYSRAGVKPAKSLKPFFSTIDTWEKVNEHCQKYDFGNYWGGLWGYITCYIMEGRKPPWIKEFLKEVNKKFDVWAYQNHQRCHLIGNLFQLGEPIPKIDRVVKIILQQQEKNGSWGDEGWNKALPQTFFAISTLRLIKDKTSKKMNPAINKGLDFIGKCYTTIQHEGKNYGGFTTTLSEICPKPLETAMGVAALLNPKLYFRWSMR
ncbi:MAG: hypothetical protein COV63_00550 [Candidatus Nealsonbacteria bacterium CG11_big_fil_rev_8_21_14_0_20_37_68]|nr:MAG: hypothetical protein COV63_00550 [Candidatus Nealsonbacteria bacterium CG11_big_fil_rev_8_21_14_0_20_37_68]